MNPAKHITQNVETIASLRARAEDDVSALQRRVESMTAAIGRPRSIHVVVFAVVAWVGINVCAEQLGWRAPDPPPCAYMQGVVGVAALLMTIMILTTQNRQSKHAEQRAHLDLQVNLLAEQKVAKLIGLVEELRKDIPTVPDRVDPVATVMTEPLDPTLVMNALEETKDSDK
ncbi:MAG TPA: DUF1003 domain-containing protein [Polyangiaceae bacterium]